MYVTNLKLTKYATTFNIAKNKYNNSYHCFGYPSNALILDANTDKSPVPRVHFANREFDRRSSTPEENQSRPRRTYTQNPQ